MGAAARTARGTQVPEAAHRMPATGPQQPKKGSDSSCRSLFTRGRTPLFHDQAHGVNAAAHHVHATGQVRGQGQYRRTVGIGRGREY